MIHGNGGSDFISSGGGNDAIYTGGGAHVVYAVPGHDRIEGDYTDSDCEVRWLYGEDGNDIVFGDYSFDNVFGGSGEDWLDGGVLDDDLHGEAGSDTKFDDHGHGLRDGGSGSDQMYGGIGGNTFLVDSVGDLVEDVIDNQQYKQGANTMRPMIKSSTASVTHWAV